MIILRAFAAALIAALAAIALLAGLHRAGVVSGGPVVLFEGEGLTVYAAPSPDWLIEPDRPAPGEEGSQIIRGARLISSEAQMNLLGDQLVEHLVMELEAATQAGVQDASVFGEVFLAGHQRAVIHGAYILRDGERIDRTDALVFDVSRAPFENASYRLTPAVTLITRVPGVQAGDRVRLEFSRIGQHRLTDPLGPANAFVAQSLDGQFMHVSALVPDDAHISAFNGLEDPEERAEAAPAGARRLVFHDDLARMVTPDPLLPPGTIQQNAVVISTLPGWNTLARWTADLFAPQPGPEVEALARRFAEAHDDPADQALAALRHVQDELRYFAVSLGDAGYAPRPPAETLARGEGDCKDKTLLLISLLDALGVEARAALVSGTLGRAVRDMPPAAQAFDHVIATFEIDGERHWVDPTIVGQGGALEDNALPMFSYALIGAPTSEDLTVLPDIDPRAHGLTVTESFLVGEGGETGQADLAYVFYGAWADAARLGLMQGGEQAVLETYEAVYELRLRAPAGGRPLEFAVADDRDANQLVVTASGPTAFVSLNPDADAPAPSFAFAPQAAYPFILSGSADRDAPLGLPFPLNIQHTVTVSQAAGLSLDIRSAGGALDLANPAFTLTRRFTNAPGGAVRLEQHLTALTQVLQPDAFEAAFADQAAGLEPAAILVGPDLVFDPGEGAPDPDGDALVAAFQPSVEAGAF